MGAVVGSNPTGDMDVCCGCCVLSGTGLCDELITRPEESYRLWCADMCDLETSRMWRPWTVLGRSATGKERKKKSSCVTPIPAVSYLQSTKWILRNVRAVISAIHRHDNLTTPGFPSASFVDDWNSARKFR